MGVQELVIVVLALVLVLVLVYVARRGTRTSGSAPTSQQPPPGYWWDGDKWNPPGHGATHE